ncbi:MAG TPA: endolytic transglycosylase MltG [Candidatus Paceibacterota bacterium]|nr:endolytic transglycosylase MltG [Candidatus Paceibacterota bacterium]
MWHRFGRVFANFTRRHLFISGGIFLVVLIGSLLIYAQLFGPVDGYAEPSQFVVRPDTDNAQVVENLSATGMVRSAWALRIALAGRHIRPGGYSLGKGMDAWTIAKVLTDPPALAFVTFPPSIRKEQMGDILADALGWSDAEKREWNTVATEPDPSFIEGVYYPDTYLIPSDQPPAQIAARLRGRFTDVFAPYAAEAQKQGIPWTKVLTLASIVDRESAKDDKALVAGILWNRLDDGMRLQADATLQYIKGTEGNWWPQPTSADKYLDSPFNTYQHTGLPPHPIDNPSLDSIAAVLHPVNTDCIFYLHDANHQIHCSLTYAGQVKNVNTYLR